MDAKTQDRIREGREARWLWNVAAPFFDEEEQAILDRAVLSREAGELTDAQAGLCLAELAVIRRLRGRLQSQIRAGDSAAARATGV